MGGDSGDIKRSEEWPRLAGSALGMSKQQKGASASQDLLQN